MLLSAKTGRVRETTPLRRLSHKFEEMKNRVIIHRLQWSGRWADQRAAVLGMVHNQYDKQHFSNLSFLHKKRAEKSSLFPLSLRPYILYIFLSIINHALREITLMKIAPRNYKFPSGRFKMDFSVAARSAH